MKHDAAVYIGRFQPCHLGHLAQMLHALDQADRLIICLGSSNLGKRTKRNPWTATERQEIILASLPEELHHRISFVRLWDLPGDDTGWCQQVRKAISDRVSEPASIAIVGLDKDPTSYYLGFFQDWHRICAEHQAINATDIRDDYFSSSTSQLNQVLPAGAWKWLLSWYRSAGYMEAESLFR